MIKRELYMNRIRPFIGGELIKVMTGIRRSGKSVMLELIKEELAEAGVAPSQMISINFEDMRYSHLQTATALHDEIIKRAEGIEGKAYLFFDEIQEVEGWESASILCEWRWTAISTLRAPTQNCCPVNWPLILADGMWSL